MPSSFESPASRSDARRHAVRLRGRTPNRGQLCGPFGSLGREPLGFPLLSLGIRPSGRPSVSSTAAHSGIHPPRMVHPRVQELGCRTTGVARVRKGPLRFSPTTAVEGRAAEKGCEKATVVSTLAPAKETRPGANARKLRRFRRSLLQMWEVEN